MAVLEVTEEDAAARARWRYRGDRRPEFAAAPAAGQQSVWDFPRPPVVEVVAASLRVMRGERAVAETRRGVRVCETAGAPTYYFPPQDVADGELAVTIGRSRCEWKGLAAIYDVPGHPGAAWSYVDTYPEYAAIEGWIAFYADSLACWVGDERVTPQPGGYYGGWVTGDLVGPIKGSPGSESWW